MKKFDSISLFSVCRMMLIVLLTSGATVSNAQTFPANFSQVAVATGISNPGICT